MGCDIHIYYERQDPRTKKWENADVWRAEEYGDEILYSHCEVGGERNYRLFGILAGVRWAGLNQIAEQRGLPEDLSQVLREEESILDGNNHSHSWLTLREIQDFDWDQPCPENLAGSLLVYRDLVGNWLPLVTAHMEKLARGEAMGDWWPYDAPLSPDQVRMVFWFDN